MQMQCSEDESYKRKQPASLQCCGRGQSLHWHPPDCSFEQVLPLEQDGIISTCSTLAVTASQIDREQPVMLAALHP